MCKTYRKVSRGQVWYLVDPKSDNYDGSIQGKNRPVIIVSNDNCNQNSPVIHVVPLTTQAKNNLPTHVHFNDGKFEQIALCEQVRPVKESLFYDKSYYKYTLSDEVMHKIEEALATQFGLSLVMPNSERFWKSVEQMIRLKVKESIRDAKVSAIDISKISCLVTKTIDSEVKIATDSEMDAMKAIEQDIDVPSDYPKLNLVEQFTEGFVMLSNDDIENMSTETKSRLIAPISKEKKQKLNVWTYETKKDFVDTYYKHGPRAAADKYNVKIGSAYRLRWQFEKEIKDATT